MKIKRIVLDMDDVLNTITLDLLRHFGVDINSYDQYPIDCGFDVRCALATMTLNPKMDLAEFWGSVTRFVWSHATLTPDFHEILDWACQHVGPTNILIATTPIECPECMAGKFEWIERNLPDWMQCQYAITPRKWWLAREDTVLIDDLPSNCDAMREWGGHAIVLPRPWNDNRMCDIMDTLEIEFQEIENANYQAMAEG